MNSCFKCFSNDPMRVFFINTVVICIKCLSNLTTEEIMLEYNNHIIYNE